MTPALTFPVVRLATAGSTNEVALGLARQGAESGTVVLAVQQEHGRGRGSKSFYSPPGGLYMSVIFRPELPAARLPLISLAAGVACAEVIEDRTGLILGLKWPNDLYLHERKLGGILAETSAFAASSESIPFVVLGVGINVNNACANFPQGLRPGTTSLYDATSRHYDLDGLAIALHRQLTVLLPLLASDVPAVLRAWQRRDCLMNRHLAWRDGSGKVMEGCGAGIGADGCYQLRAAGGSLHAILAGEVSLGPLTEQR